MGVLAVASLAVAKNCWVSSQLRARFDQRRGCGASAQPSALNREDVAQALAANIAEEELSMTDFAFNDAPNTAAFVCRHVWEDAEPIVLVCHECD